jgi:hypothetical protein
VKIAMSMIAVVALCGLGRIAGADPKPDAKPVP